VNERQYGHRPRLEQLLSVSYLKTAVLIPLFAIWVGRWLHGERRWMPETLPVVIRSERKTVG
jgi:hypothetical protein